MTEPDGGYDESILAALSLEGRRENVCPIKGLSQSRSGESRRRDDGTRRGRTSGCERTGAQFVSNQIHVAAHADATGSVSGTVTDAVTSVGILGICINVFQNDGGLGFGSTETLNDGKYSIGNLPPGIYSILVSASCSHTKLSPYANVVDASHLFTVSAGATTPGVDFALVRSGSISGNAGLALRRANEAAKLLKADTQGVLHVTVHVVTSASKNAVTVTTTKN